jgi:carboxyl-terminal processing protease
MAARRSLLAAGLSAWFAVLGLASFAPAQSVAPAQRPTVTLAQPIPATNDLAAVFEQGARLEQERRWAEALQFYEEKLRLHPDQTELKSRVTVARAHYDVCRRYSDHTYVSALASLSERDALAIYDEVLLKIQSNYVHEPRWQQVLTSGLTNLDVAITEQSFRERNLKDVSVERLAQVQRQLREISSTRRVTDRRQAWEAVRSVASTLNQQHGLSSTAVILEFTSGAAAALDEYSGFLTGGQMDEVFSQIEGNFVGLGVELKTEPAGLLIVSVIPTGPAAQGGIVPGDRLIEINGQTTADNTPDVLADMLRGADGSQVEVVARNPAGESRRLSLTRRRVEVPSVEQVKIVDSQYGIGYFKLTSFQKTTSRDVDAALWKLHEQGMKYLIIDLRGNPGGLLKAAVDVADKFVFEGLIVSTRGRSPREDFDHKGEQAGTWRVPLILLIDHDSASASEILAGAIRDHKRGTVVGIKSYGKGSVQGIFPLTAANVGVRLTTAKWFTPSGQAISGQGIAPDVAVQIAAKTVDGLPPLEGAAEQPVATTPADAILQAGLQVARAQYTSRRPTP